MAPSLCASIGRPSSVSSCVGTDAQKRYPRPPAGIMAETCIRAMLPGQTEGPKRLRRFGCSEHGSGLPLQAVANVLDRFADLATCGAETLAELALRLIGLALGVQRLVIGQVACRLL